MTPTADGRICVQVRIAGCGSMNSNRAFTLIALKTGSYADIAFALPNISTY